MRRARVRTVPLDSADPVSGSRYPEPAAPAAPDPVETETLGRALERALASLRPEYRAAVVLRYQESLSFDEIATVMNVPAATARTYVHRARREMAAFLRASGWQPSP